MKKQEALAYPLSGYRILNNPEQPTLAVIALETDGGPSLFAVTREILEQLGEAFLRHAESMTSKLDQN